MALFNQTGLEQTDLRLIVNYQTFLIATQSAYFIPCAFCPFRLRLFCCWRLSCLYCNRLWSCADSTSHFTNICNQCYWTVDIRSWKIRHHHTRHKLSDSSEALFWKPIFLKSFIRSLKLSLSSNLGNIEHIRDCQNRSESFL